MDNDTTIEQSDLELMQQLNAQRAAPVRPAAEPSFAQQQNIAKLEELAANNEEIVTFVMVSLIAGGNAFLNYIVIGAVPIVGDAIDLGAGVTISAFLFTLKGHPRWKAQGVMWLLTAVELVPGTDIASPQAIGAVLALVIAWSAGTKAERQLEQIHDGGVPDEFESEE